MNARLLLEPDEPEAATTLRPNGLSTFFLTCEHADNRLPRKLGLLGLSDEDLRRHIAWDIGAGGVAKGLSERLDATLVMQNYSRLAVDCNRAPHADDFIPVVSETTEIPGNRDIAADEREARERELFEPYHAAVRSALDARAAAGRPSVLVSVHSCTPVYHGVWRPWHIGVMYNRDDRFAAALLTVLKQHGELTVGENKPYDLDHDRDYAVPVHGERRGILHTQLEIRQDLITDAKGQAEWADRLAGALRESLAAVGA